MSERIARRFITRRRVLVTGVAGAVVTVVAASRCDSQSSVTPPSTQATISTLQEELSATRARIAKLEPITTPPKKPDQPPYTPNEREEMSRRVNLAGSLLRRALSADILDNLSSTSYNPNTRRLAWIDAVTNNKIIVGPNRINEYDQIVHAALGDYSPVLGGYSFFVRDAELRFSDPTLSRYFSSGFSEYNLHLKVLNLYVDKRNGDPHYLDSSTVYFEPRTALQEIIEREDLVSVAGKLFNLPWGGHGVTYSFSEPSPLVYSLKAPMATISGYSEDGQQITIKIDSLGRASYDLKP